MHELQHEDTLKERFCNKTSLTEAHTLLVQEDQTEEAFLGAQGVLLLNGLL